MAPDSHPFERGLDRRAANYAPLSPVSFLTRAATAFRDRTDQIIDHGGRLFRDAGTFDYASISYKRDASISRHFKQELSLLS